MAERAFGRSAASDRRTARRRRRKSDVVVLIVPVMLDAASHPDHRSMDAAVAAIAPGLHAGATVVFETTLPVGDTRDRYAPALAEAIRADARG